MYCEALFDQSNAPSRCECGSSSNATATCNSTSHLEYSNNVGGIPCFLLEDNYSTSILAAGTGVFIAVFVGSVVCCCCAVGLFAWCCIYILKPKRHIRQEHSYATGAAIPPSSQMMPPIKETTDDDDALDTTTTTTTVQQYEENPPAFAPTTNDYNLPVAEAVVYDVDGSKV